MSSTSMTNYIQTIYFGPPGCGKSFRVREVAKDILDIEPQSPRLIETTFHPEYSYGAFKRRWDFEYMPWTGAGTGDAVDRQGGAVIEGTDHSWRAFLERLNAYIAANFVGRNVDDKQLGLWFLRSLTHAKAAQLTELQSRIEPLKDNPTQTAWKLVFPGATAL